VEVKIALKLFNSEVLFSAISLYMILTGISYLVAFAVMMSASAGLDFYQSTVKWLMGGLGARELAEERAIVPPGVSVFLVIGGNFFLWLFIAAITSAIGLLKHRLWARDLTMLLQIIDVLVGFVALLIYHTWGVTIAFLFTLGYAILILLYLSRPHLWEGYFQ
jgi:Ca2+/Na+ antiporter